MAIDQAPTSVAASFEALYRTSADAVYAYTASLLRDRSAAEEVTAAAFERAFRKQRSFDPRRGTQRAWLFGIARNAALDELRRRKRSAELSGRARRRRGGARGRGRGRRAPRHRARRAGRRWTRASASSSP